MADRVALTFWRHGLTVANERQLYNGWGDVPLSPEGKRAIQRMHHSLEEPELLFSSDLSRCLDTARLLYPDMPIESVPELREINFGDWEGHGYDALKNVPSYQKWLDAPFTARPDGGETFPEFTDRVQRGVDVIVGRINERNVNEAAIVTHGGVLRYLLTSFAPEKRPFFDWTIPNNGGYRLEWTREGLRRRQRCMSLQAVLTTEKQRG
ncbi:histidine phosphatase family protein [Lentibacillus saliphilus]|uniref:histidine phosphatase family protein n=1 Tax=Lentibacillus saliphilus TaxID=2737028 RepID=UPI001C3092C6|nr:histidine phosphatase family protein [Lentibacillus saliphilus]